MRKYLAELLYSQRGGPGAADLLCPSASDCASLTFCATYGQNGRGAWPLCAFFVHMEVFYGFD